jgi:sarcosine oxidase subunit alpha
MTGAAIPAGAQLTVSADRQRPGQSEGVVTSPTFSQALDRFIALGLLTDGRARMGEVMYAADPLRRRHIQVEIVSPYFYDPEGARLDA